MMNSIGIYKIDNDLFFLPHCTAGEYFSRSIEPILEISFDAPLDKLGEVFLETFKHCTNVTTMKDLPEGSFKKFLQVSKVRSQINLVKKALYISAKLSDNSFTITRVGANIRYKGFMVDLGIEPKVINVSVHPELIGKAIKELFLVEK